MTTNIDNRKTKRPWAKAMKSYSVRLDSEQAKTLRNLVKRLKMSQSRVFCAALERYAREMTDSE